MITYAFHVRLLIQLKPKKTCRQFWWFKNVLKVGTLKTDYIFLILGWKCYYDSLYQTGCWNSFPQQLKHISVTGCFNIFGLFCMQVRYGKMTKHYFVWWAWCITEVEEGNCWSSAGAAESSCWQKGRWDVESVSELAGWHGYHSTNSLATEETEANCRAASGRNRPSVRRCKACCSCPCHCPRPATRQPNKPACHQGHTDGLLQGGSECNADLRARAVLVTAAHVQIYTTAWQINMLTFLCQIKYNT